jgi:hypothetical protein
MRVGAGAVCEFEHNVGGHSYSPLAVAPRSRREFQTLGEDFDAAFSLEILAGLADSVSDQSCLVRLNLNPFRINQVRALLGRILRADVQRDRD